MKIKMNEDYQGLKADQVIENMCPSTGSVLISKGVAVEVVEKPAEKPAEEPKPDAFAGNYQNDSR